MGAGTEAEAKTRLAQTSAERSTLGSVPRAGHTEATSKIKVRREFSFPG